MLFPKKAIIRCVRCDVRVGSIISPYTIEHDGTPVCMKCIDKESRINRELEHKQKVKEHTEYRRLKKVTQLRRKLIMEKLSKKVV